MKTDVYSHFLTGKVKVFSTKKGGKPFYLSSKILRRACPFLLASAMMTSSCRSDTRATDVPSSENEWMNIYNEVVEKYHLTSLQDKEPLSKEQIDSLMDSGCAVLTADANFNHRPENAANFWDIVTSGIEMTKRVQNSPNLTAAQKKEYQITAYKMLSQISQTKGRSPEVDVSDYNNLKAFLYFEKVLRYGDSYADVMHQQEGWIDEKHEIFGRFYKDYQKLEEKAAKSGVERFAKALYLEDKRFILSFQDSAKANKISYQDLRQWLEKQEIRDKGLWKLSENEDESYCNAIAYWYHRGNNLGILLNVDKAGDLGDGDYAPVGVTIIHELQHVMQKEPASAEKPEDNQRTDEETVGRRFNSAGSYISELGPTLYSLALQDRIYKQIHGIEAHQTVDYGYMDMNGKKISLGEIAVWFSGVTEKYPYPSVDKVLSENEVFKQLERWGNAGRNAKMVSVDKMR